MWWAGGAATPGPLAPSALGSSRYPIAGVDASTANRRYFRIVRNRLGSWWATVQNVFREPLPWVYAGLGGGAFVALVLWWLFGSRSPFAAGWLPNLGTELTAIVVAVALVDWAVKRQQTTRRQRIRAVTSHSLQGALRPLVFEALVTMRHDAQAAELPSTLYDLFEQWTRFIREREYKTPVDNSHPRSSVMLLRALRDRWSQLRGQLAALEADLPLLIAVDDFVGWMDLNDELFDYKVGKYEWGIDALGRGVDEYKAWNPSGDVRPSLTQLIVGAGDRIVDVLAAFRSADLPEPRVHPDELSALETLWSPQGRALFDTARAPLEFE